LAARDRLSEVSARFCQECGARMELRPVEGREVPHCPSCGFVAWRNPLVATMVVVETPDGIVLGRRAIEPGLGLWCLPGGFVNEEEDPKEAAARECAEEIRARVEIDALLDVYHITRGDGRGMVGVAYAGHLFDGESPGTGSEMTEVGTFRLEQLPELAFASHRRAIADWTRARAGR
jgi:8-oxo-dGTP diphosphatase